MSPSTVFQTPFSVLDNTLFGAWTVTKALKNGRTQMDVVTEAGGVEQFGIGMMMFRLQDKGLLRSEDEAYHRLIEELPLWRTTDGATVAANRRTVLDHLRKIKLLDDGLPVRALKPAGTTPSATQVLEVTEEVTNVPVRDITSRRRSKDIVKARFMAMWVLRTVSGISFSVIGEHLGGKDHTSVINGVSQVDLRRKMIKATREETDRIADDADHLGIKSSMEILLRQSRLKLV